MSFVDWLFGNGVKSLPQSEYLYGFKHILTLALVAVAAVVLAIVFKNNKKGQKIIINTIVALLAFLEVFSRIINLIKNNVWTFEKLWSIIMPCHFCSIVVVAFLVAFFAKKQWLLNACVVAGFMASGAYLAFPGVGLNTNIMAFPQIYSTVSHAVAMVLCVLLVVYKKVDFNFKKIYQPILFYAFSIGYALILNLVIYPGSNYMYYVKNEFGFSMHIVTYRLMLLLAVMLEITVCYLPSIIKTLKHKKEIVL